MVVGVDGNGAQHVMRAVEEVLCVLQEIALARPLKIAELIVKDQKKSLRNAILRNATKVLKTITK